MVMKELFEGKEAYRCEICGFHYENEADAESCEEACSEGVCSNEITAKALERKG